MMPVLMREGGSVVECSTWTSKLQPRREIVSVLSGSVERAMSKLP